MAAPSDSTHIDVGSGGPASGPSPNKAPRSTGAGGLEKELSRAERGKFRVVLWVLLGVVAMAAVIVVIAVKAKPKPQPKYVIGATSQGDVTESIQSTGQVQPLTQVQVGAQVSGRITKVMVDFNTEVKKGDVLAEIDPTLFGAAIDQNRAQLASAEASVARAEAAKLAAKQRWERTKRLVAEGIGTQADLDAAQGSYDVAIADEAAAKASVAQIQAALRSSRTNMEYTRIFSPIDGVVITRSIDPGQTVAASFQAPVLFVIAQDLRKMRVLADIDEADVGKLREGMRAEVTVDAFPGERFKGTVSQVRYSPSTQSGVVTYAAVIDVDNPDLKLRPGMTATVTIRTAEAKAVTRIPNAALRFKPSPPVDKDGKKIPQDPLPPLGAHKGRIYVITDETLGKEKVAPREIEIGITDGVTTELKTDLSAVKIVVDETDDPNKKRSF